MAVRNFDLNIERVLEHWTIPHAIREIIANALDEQALTNTDEPSIYQDEIGRWHVRDWGRGFRYEHLTQNENAEKLARPDSMVGKFGVGLKDALATFDRHGIQVLIRSQFGEISIAKAKKHGFDEVATLHALISEPRDPSIVGTDVILKGIDPSDIDSAKNLFLQYTGVEPLERTQFGEVLARSPETAAIYVNGLRVAEEPNFLFSYNITALSKPLRQALNRERTNVGRSAYTDRVKAILLATTTSEVATRLAQDVKQYQSGNWHDELHWADVAVHASQILNASEQVVFMSPSDLSNSREFVDRAQDDGYRVVVMPESVRSRLGGVLDTANQPIRDLARYQDQWSASFHFSFVPPSQLSSAEHAIWDKQSDIWRLAGGKPRNVVEVLISETMRPSGTSRAETVGLWDPTNKRIIVKRNQLANLAEFAGTLLHEIAHAQSGASDVSGEFEDALTTEIGEIADRVLKD